jgi:hypothetical protein
VSRAAFLALLAAAGLRAATAAPVIANGGFEAGLSGWTVADQAGSDGGFSLQSGTSSPVLGDPVPAPPEGVAAAMSDAGGPGSHLLYQDFVASAGAAVLGFDLFIGNRSDRFATPDTLAFDGAAINMQARVDILAAAADPFSVSAGDVLLSVFRTAVGDALVSGYASFNVDLTALMSTYDGQTLRLRFAETDNLGPLQMGVDNVTISGGTVPEPAGFALAGLALAALAASRRRV